MSKQVTTDIECPVCTHKWNVNLVKPTVSKASVFTKQCPECSSNILIKAVAAGVKKCLLKILDIEVSTKGKEIFQSRIKKSQEIYETVGNDVIQSDGK